MPLALALATSAFLATVPFSVPDSLPAVGSVVSRPAPTPTRQEFTWRWTDGSKATERTFHESKYHSAERIPKFQVTVKPPTPPWTARLLFWVNGEWAPRQVQRSDAQGKMKLEFLPIGPEGQWENVTWIVRIRLKPVSTRQRAAIAPRVKVRELLLTIHYVSR